MSATRDLVPAATSLGPVSDRAEAYFAQQLSPHTLATYAGYWNIFRAWCEARAVTSLPASPETVADYIASLADRGVKAASITLALSALNHVHATRHDPRFESFNAHPGVRGVLQGIRRVIGTAQDQAPPVTIDHLRAMSRSCPDTRRGVRDRAMILLGFAGGFRRSELLGLEVPHLAFRPHGLEVTLAHSKTDQTGKGRTIPIAFGADPRTCPVRAVQAWIADSGVVDGFLFRNLGAGDRVTRYPLSERAVERVLQASAKRAGIAVRFQGHSLRVGLVTAALDAGKSFASVRAVTGHSGNGLLRYYAVKERWRDPANLGIGL